MATVTRERDTLSKMVTELDKEKGELEAEKSATIKKLSKKAESYKGALAGYKEALQERYKLVLRK